MESFSHTWSVCVLLLNLPLQGNKDEVFAIVDFIGYSFLSHVSRQSPDLSGKEATLL